MNQIKILTIREGIVLDLIKFSLLLGVATLAPLMNNQAITGSTVNAILFISTLILGVRGALLIGLLPSLIALSVGLLPSILAPMVPFIMVGNAILVLIFDFLRKKNYWLGMISASFLKFIFLAATSSIVITQKAAMMMSWPQLLTALAGGTIAYFFLKTIKKI